MGKYNVIDAKVVTPERFNNILQGKEDNDKPMDKVQAWKKYMSNIAFDGQSIEVMTVIKDGFFSGFDAAKDEYAISKTFMHGFRDGQKGERLRVVEAIKKEIEKQFTYSMSTRINKIIDRVGGNKQ